MAAQTSRLVIELDSRDAEAKAADTRKALEALEDAGLRVQPALNKAGDGMESMGKRSDKATKSVQEQRDEIDQLLGSINPLARKMNELEKQELALAKAHKAGKIETDTYTEYQAKITETRRALTNFDGSLTRTGNTAKQTAAALRGVPAQFTDIAVSLQGGQAPLTVLLQQGGQLKDMFGGVGPAAKALGGYVAGLINPFTLAGAAVAAFTFAAYKGYEQAEEYRKALTMTGDAAGRTADDLIALSTSIAGGRNFSEASQAVLALANNGRLVGEAFTEVARAATELSVATGKSADDIADQLSSTKGSVTDLAAEYSDKYGVITQAVFEQVRSLDQQGERMEAIKVLAGVVADEMGARNKEMVDSTRGLARAWDDVKTSISGAWSELKSGLSASPEMFKLQHLQGQLQDAQKLGDKALISGLEKQVSLAQAAVDAQTQKKEGVSAELQERKVTIAADKAWAEDGLKYRSNQKKMEEDIAKARAKGVAAKASEAEIEQRLGQIRAEYASKEKKPVAPKTYTEDSGQKMLDEARQRFAVLQQQNKAITDQTSGSATLGAEARKLIELETVLADLKIKGTLTAAQKQILAMGELNLAQQKQNAALEKANELTKERFENEAKLKAFRENLDSQLELSREGQANELSGAGQSDRLRARLQEDLKIRQDYQKQLDKLTRDYNKIDNPTANDTDLYKGETDALRSALATRMADQQNYYAAQDAMRGAWLVGVSESWQNYVDIATNYNEQARAATESILGDTTSALSGGIQDVIKQTESLGDAFGNLAGTMANSVLGALSDIAAKWVVVQALKMAGITAETGAVVAAEGTKAAAKVAADGIAEASSLSTIATTLAANVAAAIETLASWAPAALVASIGSFGAAAAVGGTALIAAYALIKGISGGFAEGGYTGAGGVNEYAGAVHKGEVVWSQSDIRKAGGVASVEALRNGNVSAGRSASGGGNSSTAASDTRVAAPSGTVVNIHEDASRAGQVQTSTAPDGKQMMEIFVSNFKGQTGPAKAFEQMYGLKRVGR